MPERTTTRSATGRLSELEGAVLGLLWRAGPMTAHAVRQIFHDSPTSHFSGSAGAIYPLIRRLHDTSLIAKSPDAAGAKGGAAYTITPKGRSALKAWMQPHDPAWLTTVMFDPLRTRMLTIGILTPRQRATFLEHAERELGAAAQQQAVELLEANTDEWTAAALQGALAVTRARLRWIRSLRRDRSN
ncbi:MAG: PadR family transcriptional regulator [Planctomycetota bacterium]|nr:MAG: PadR family transcriptional regulator [Planctomycetota bacterium]